MKKADAPILMSDEPIGIIISRGFSGEEAPAMFAYAYSDVPETDDESLASSAA